MNFPSTCNAVLFHRKLEFAIWRVEQIGQLRYWHKAREQDPARAHYALAYIGRLQEAERATRDCDAMRCDAMTRKAARSEHAAPLLAAEFGNWLQRETFLPKSLIGKAATYTRNQWTALNRYMENGDMSFDNNFAERAMRPIAIGRKNWLFDGSELAGHRAAILTSLVASCKNNLVEPWAYLKDVFTRLAGSIDTEELSQLLPDRRLKANPTTNAGKSPRPGKRATVVPRALTAILIYLPPARQCVVVLHTQATVATITQCSAASDVVSLRLRGFASVELNARR